VPNFGSVGYLLLYLVGGIKDAGLAVEHQTVGIGNVLQRLLIDTMLAAYGEVDSAVLSLVGNNDIGWNIFREGSASLYHGTNANACLGIFNDTTGEDDGILNQTVACNLRTIAEDAAVSNLGVMRDVCTLHQEVVVADGGLSAAMCGTVDDYILSDNVVVADDALRLLPSEFEVLRQCTDDGALVYLVVVTHARTIKNADEGEDDAVVTNHHIVLNVHKGEYLTIVADFRLGRYFSFGTYFACHNFSLFTNH